MRRNPFVIDRLFTGCDAGGSVRVVIGGLGAGFCADCDAGDAVGVAICMIWLIPIQVATLRGWFASGFA